MAPLPSYLLDRVPSAEIITLLLDAGAEVNAADQQGNTPLHMAAAPGAGWNNPSDVGFIKALLDAGADTTAVNDDGDTACDVARRFDEGEAAQDLLCRYPASATGPTPTPHAGVEVSTPPGQAQDMETLLRARDALAGGAALNWSEEAPIDQWDGVETGGPRGSRVPDQPFHEGADRADTAGALENSPTWQS